MNKKIKPVIGKVGGKARIAPWILSFIKQHQFSIYCEPFAGSAAVYFALLNDGIPEQIKARGRHFRAVLNDADKEIIGLYRTVRDYPELLAYSVYFTPYSRAEHKEAQQRGTGDRIEEARRYLVDGWQGFAKQSGNSWGINRYYEKHDELKENLGNWRVLPDRILTAAPHLGTPHQELLEMAEMLIQLALSEKPIDNELESRIEEARRYLVDGWQSFKYMPKDSWGIALETDKKRSGKNLENVFSTLPDRILAAAPHLGTREVPDLYACLNAAGRAFVKTDVDFRVEWARQYLVRNWQSVVSEDTGWSINNGVTTPRKTTQERWHECVPTRILAASPHLQQDLDALKKVYLECDDAIKVIERWATPETLFYVDAPYLSKENYYSHNAKAGKEYNLELHYRLAECLNRVECAGAIASYYPDELFDELYPEEYWERHYKETVASSAGITRQSKSKKRPKRVEMLLIRKQKNPDKKIVNMSGQMSLF